MYIIPAIKPMCDHCIVIRRNGKVKIIHKGDRKCRNA